ncbi:MAG: alpha/beta hydrolase [Anaerolineae bacterium]|nr:alpha/beta hydrolase [Anaerolineae bacterium]
MWLFSQLDRNSSYGAPPNLEAIESSVVVVPDLLYADSSLDDSRLDIIYPASAGGPLPVVVYIHGGGYVVGSKEQTRVYAMALAHAGYVVANIDYALAPSYQYPNPIAQTNAALRYLNDNAAQYGGDMNRLFFAGNSAGAQIASQMAAMISSEAFAQEMGIEPAVTRDQLRGTVLLNGIYNMDTVRATGLPGIEQFLWSYTGVRQFESFDRIEELSTVQHVTADYPPVFLTAGDIDAVAPQSDELKAVLEANGVEVDAVLFTGTGANLNHDYALNLNVAAAQQTLERTLAFLAANSQPE